MITATTKEYGTVKVDFAINRGQWFGKTWLIEVGMGYDSCFVLVEADDESDAIDVLADSKRSYLIDTDEDLGDDWNTRAGNDGHLVNLDNVGIRRCTVNYFAPRS